MIIKTSGYYAVNGNRAIVDEGLIMTCPDSAVIEEFDTLEALDAAYPVPEEIE